MEDSLLVQIVKINPNFIGDFIKYLRANNHNETLVLQLPTIASISYLKDYIEQYHKAIIICDNYSCNVWAMAECKLTHIGGIIHDDRHDDISTSIITEECKAILKVAEVLTKPF